MLSVHIEALTGVRLVCGNSSSICSAGVMIIESKHLESLLAYTYQFSSPAIGGSFGPPPLIGTLPEYRQERSESGRIKH